MAESNVLELTLKSRGKMDVLDQAFNSLKRELEDAVGRQARAARDAFTSDLNQLMRRLRQYGSEGEWVNTLVESASRFAGRLAAFEVRKDVLYLRGQRQLQLPPDLAITLTSAPAFANCVSAKDTVISLCTPSEVGLELGADAGVGRARLIPVPNGDRVVAVLFAMDDAKLDPNALELLAGIASLVLERGGNASLHAQIAPAPPVEKIVRDAAPLPDWSDLSPKEQTLHLRAQRFSRVAVAEAQLARPEACAAGRRAGDLYLFLQTEIDRARDTYREQFMTIPSMVDYLHLELVRVLAEEDETLMGAEYSGAMV